MIEPVDSSPTKEPTVKQAAAGSARGKSFASMLGHATGPAIPDGETWTPVAHHRSYAKIVSGPRKGQYINLGLGDRHGQTFQIEHRGGKTVHVYGSGAVVGARSDMPALAAGTASDTPPHGEIWAPVPGTTAWADILGGPRDGMFVNTSGNSRQGMAFEVVHRSGKTYHMYGSGPHRLMVEIRESPHPHAAAPAVGGGISVPTS